MSCLHVMSTGEALKPRYSTLVGLCLANVNFKRISTDILSLLALHSFDDSAWAVEEAPQAFVKASLSVRFGFSSLDQVHWYVGSTF